MNKHDRAAIDWDCVLDYHPKGDPMTKKWKYDFRDCVHSAVYWSLVDKWYTCADCGHVFSEETGEELVERNYANRDLGKETP